MSGPETPPSSRASLLVGAHLGIGKGLAGAVAQARGLGADALQVFTKAPAIWRAKPVDPERAAAFRAAVEEGPMTVVVHDSYLVNLCAGTEELREKSYASLADELDRCAIYGIGLLNSHMGAHVGQGTTEGVRLVGLATRRLLAGSDPAVSLLMETTAGKGSCLGGSFEELARMLDAAGGDARLGVCLDTCHVWDAGYDLSTPEAVAATLDEFDRVVGLERLKAIHLNDSKHPRGSRKDRHANVGAGEVGREGLAALAREPRLRNVPIILETPHEDDAHIEDLRWLRETRGRAHGDAGPEGPGDREARGERGGAADGS